MAGERLPMLTDALPAISCDALLAHSWRHLDLFSGIGGFALACRMVGGIETVGFCEREPYAQKVLKKHWPDVPICNDIHKMKGNDYGTIDLITGGFPCQPYSLAGERRGNEDDRALWPQMLRVISEARPAWVLGENVVGLLSMGFQEIRTDLESLGYSVGCAVIPAHSKDAPHKRDRVWILCHLSDSEGLPVEERTEEPLPRIANIQVEFGRVGEAVGIRSELCDGIITGVVDGVSAGMDRHRKSRVIALGNAIVPQVAAEIIAAMKRVDIGANEKVRDGASPFSRPSC